MSGGFFRGTSADQDTRFSNKQAKLMKSQKFASELDHLVDITKVKMDVMRPWITNRVTELLGFEDEVLINFIFGLLDGKGVNGKEVQIQLTGFMEKNTGKFMKELWALLLSAQNNASGVPQQLLDAKEEETRKKKAETDRIANEIQKKKEKEKEGRELEQEKLRKMDGENDASRANNAGLDTSLKHQPRASSVHPANENESSERNGSRGRGRVSRSPHSADRSPSPLRRSRSRSVSKSFSNSRSYSDERNKSRSITRSPQQRRRSISSERVSHSPPRRSVSPRKRLSPQRSPSPLRRRSSHSRRRSTSRTRRSPSPVRRRRSPLRRRSRSPIRRRSRPPFIRRSRSPTRRRSPSPIRRRSPSPIRRRSPSPVRRRMLSPIRRRSPSPVQRRSPSPIRRRYRRSPSTPPRRFVSPIRRRSPFRGRRRSPAPSRHRSPSPREWSSQSPVRRTSPSPVKRKSPQLQRRSPVQSPRERERMRQHGKFSPVHHAPLRDNAEDPVDSRKGVDSVSRRPPVSLMSPQRDLSVRNKSREKVPSSSPSPYRSPLRSESPLGARKRSPREDRSPYESPLKHTIQSPSRKPREHKPLRDSLGASGEDEAIIYAREHGGQKHKPVEKRFSLSSTADQRKDGVEMAHYKDEYPPERLPSHRSRETRSRTDSLEQRKNDQEMMSERTTGKMLHPEVPDQPKLPIINEADGKNRSHSENVKNIHRNPKDPLLKSARKVEKNDRSGSLDSISAESDKQIAEVSEKRKHKRSEKKQVASDDDYSSDSPIEDRKESKRRRKDEKKMRKEEKRRRREERRRRKEHRRAEKLKMKSIDTVTPPSDLEKSRDGYASDGEHFRRKDSRASDTEKAESEQKKLEIELREKALESLRAKKGAGH